MYGAVRRETPSWSAMSYCLLEIWHARVTGARHYIQEIIRVFDDIPSEKSRRTITCTEVRDTRQCRRMMNQNDTLVLLYRLDNRRTSKRKRAHQLQGTFHGIVQLFINITFDACLSKRWNISSSVRNVLRLCSADRHATPVSKVCHFQENRLSQDPADWILGKDGFKLILRKIA